MFSFRWILKSLCCNIFLHYTKTASRRVQIQYALEVLYIISVKGKTDFRTVRKYRDQLHDSHSSSFPSISAFHPNVVRAASNLKVRRIDRGLSRARYGVKFMETVCACGFMRIQCLNWKIIGQGPAYRLFSW